MRVDKILRILALTLLIGSMAAFPVAAKTTVKVASWWSFETGSPLDVLKQAFEEANPDIEIEYIQIPSSEYYTKVLTMIAGGTPPDMVMLGMDKLGSWVPRGALQELTPYIEASGYDLGQLFPAVREAIEFRGGIYALPRDATTSTLAYNKTMFREAGISYPVPGWTQADFLETARKLVQKDNNRTKVYGYAFDTFSDGFIDWLYVNGANLINDEANRSALHEPEAIAVLEFLQGMVREGIAPEPSLTATFSNASGAFKSQRAAMYVTTVGWANSFAQDPNLDWDVVPLPTWTRDSKPATRLWVNYWALPKGSPHAEEAFKVMAFFAGPKGQEIVGEQRMGIPGIPEIAYGSSFAGLPGAPAHKEYFLDVMDWAIPFPLFPQSDQFFTVMKREFDQMWTCERSVEEAVKALDRATLPLFK